MMGTVQCRCRIQYWCRPSRTTSVQRQPVKSNRLWGAKFWVRRDFYKFATHSSLQSNLKRFICTGNSQWAQLIWRQTRKTRLLSFMSTHHDRGRTTGKARFSQPWGILSTVGVTQWFPRLTLRSWCTTSHSTPTSLPKSKTRTMKS